MTVTVTVEFFGGLELIFAKRRKIKVTLPHRDTQVENPSATTVLAAKESEASATSSIGEAATFKISDLVNYLVEVEMTNPDKSRELLVSTDGQVRPGILVLINETDWELEGEGEYVLQQGDQIMFVSTLHGG
ncbi:hypothetical protein BCR37DRAFT_375923 [Protomyces lactucae-debilis]|uniref:Ubiquitin-related modifier 1 n=1 Tax=Protomyces lactucae-debilis TaxID=2754530 RepID=A0A1Y2FVD8_PROLT|nr:uncharacterized protein BCR37DRAFT_375923 [Protomyces lactucae-debilis]ORY87952.1 hypothetical protein BCR37DRAFT_375923 [Protomyces lactucae-debilis]